MSKPSNRKTMLKKDLIDENIRLQNKITKMNDDHFNYQQSVILDISAKASQIQKLTTGLSKKKTTVLSMKEDLKRSKITGNKLASIISDQIPKTTTNSLLSGISQRELAQFCVFSGLTQEQTFNEEIRSGLTVIHYKRSRSDENTSQLPVFNKDCQFSDIISQSDDVEKESEQFETEIFPIPTISEKEPDISRSPGHLRVKRCVTFADARGSPLTGKIFLTILD